jgi:hypothetical protein
MRLSCGVELIKISCFINTKGAGASYGRRVGAGTYRVNGDRRLEKDLGRAKTVYRANYA